MLNVGRVWWRQAAATGTGAGYASSPAPLPNEWFDSLCHSSDEASEATLGVNLERAFASLRSAASR